MSIKYNEGSSLPHFEGDPHTMTANEAMQLASRHDMKPLAKEMSSLVVEYIRERLAFDGNIGDVSSHLARKIMGNDRPLHDDDAPYYEFQDRVQRYIVGVMIEGMNRALREAHLD